MTGRAAGGRARALVRRRAWRGAWILAGVVGLAGPAPAQELTLSVAISMKDAVEEIGRGFQASRPGVTLHYNVGASGDLQKQIESGAPVDVFVSAGPPQSGEPARRPVVAASRRADSGPEVPVVAIPP